MPKVLFVGFGISGNRTEAVSINTDRTIRSLITEGVSVKTFNIGFESGKNSGSTNRMFLSVLKQRDIRRQIVELVKKDKITHIYDTFVLPGASLIFTLPLKKILPNVTFVKEIHNSHGYSKKISTETFIRFFLNTKYQINIVKRNFDKIITRNKNLSKKYGALHVPAAVQIFPYSRQRSAKLRLSFLGHPLNKKGISKFYKLMEILPENIKNKVQFSFAFSDIVSSQRVITQLKSLADKNNISINFAGKVRPHSFFREQDVLLLPLFDEFSSAGSLNTVLEAMEAGCLVVTTKTLISTAFVRHMHNGILMEQSSAEEMSSIVLGIASKKHKIKRLVKKARADIMLGHSSQVLKSKVKKIYE